MIKMIVTDLDDTLLRRDRSISDFTKEVFAECRKKGILTAFATARVAVSATEELVPLPVDIRIVSNGAMAICGERELYFNGIEAEAANRLITRLKQSGASDILVSCRKEAFWESDRIAGSAVLRRAVWCDFSKPLTRAADQICFILSDQEAVRQLKEEFLEYAWISYRDGSHAAAQKGVSKLYGIKRTAALYGIKLSEIAAFGDDAGDCEMLTHCGIGIAVDNSVPEAKKAANHVTASNEEDGVARFIRDRLLQ